MQSLRALAQQVCMPIAAGAPLTAAEAAPLAAALGEGWVVHGGERLRRRYSFPDFAQALAFVNAVGALAEAVAHHPDIAFGWGRAEIELYTHDIGGLAEADFVLAARIELLPR